MNLCQEMRKKIGQAQINDGARPSSGNQQFQLICANLLSGWIYLILITHCRFLPSFYNNIYRGLNTFFVCDNKFIYKFTKRIHLCYTHILQSKIICVYSTLLRYFHSSFFIFFILPLRSRAVK